MRLRFQDRPEEAELRARLRAWLHDLLPDGWPEAVADGDEETLTRLRGAWDTGAFWDEMGQAGYAAPGWPEEHGGLGAGPWAQRVIVEELRSLRLPVVSPNILGLGMAGPTIMEHGTAWQKERFLPPILSSEEVWCQLFSEPAAGSDLANVATRAEPRGDGFSATGQKVWTSLAHLARWGMLLARTDPDAPKHAGLTWFILDMEDPGVEVRPLTQMTGDAEFNEVFLDEVRLPADHVVGGVGNGWKVAKTTLMHERVALSGAAFGGGEPHRELLEEARRIVEERGPLSEELRDEIVRRFIEAEVKGATSARIAARRRTGDPVGPEGSIGKLYNAELNQRMSVTALRLHGTRAMLWDDAHPDTARAVWSFLRARANTIEGGTSEILRNVIGERVLGLPRPPRIDLDRPWREVR